MEKKTFAQLKRDLKVGMKVQQTKNEMRPTINNEIREISIVQTNAVAFKTNKNGKMVHSWLWFPKKASDVIYTGDEFTFIVEGKKISYKIIKKMSRKSYTSKLLLKKGYTVKELELFKEMLTQGISESYLDNYRELMQAIDLAIKEIELRGLK